MLASLTRYKNKLVSVLSLLYCCYPQEKIIQAFPAPWHPMSDPVDIKHLGKLGEELNELGKEVNRTLIQGIDEINPDTGLPNRTHLEQEIADVYANIQLCMERFDLHLDTDRIKIKLSKLSNWHKDA